MKSPTFSRILEILAPNPKADPKPNPYPFLDPGRVIPGNAGGLGPRRRAGSRNPNPLGGCAPQTPARVSSGRSGVQRHICYRLILLFLIQRHMFLTSYFINLVSPVCGPCGPKFRNVTFSTDLVVHMIYQKGA